MSTVPYIFATQNGNIALSELDANFANVKANVDYATNAGSATVATSATNALTANTVTGNAQTNITSVGTLTSVTVSGNAVVGNLNTAGVISATGNVTGGNVITGGVVSATGNVRGSNLNTAGIVSATGNVVGGNVVTAGLVSATGNITGGNISSSGAISAVGNLTVSGNVSITKSLTLNGLEFAAPNWVQVSSNVTDTLSNTTSYNFYYATNPGYTLTINMPVNPIEGQITRFATSGNSMVLVAGTGNLNASFAGNATPGTVYKYVYRDVNLTWVRSA